MGLGDVGAGVFGVGVFNLELSDVGDGFVEGGVGSRTEAGGTQVVQAMMQFSGG